jgi:hypothetical protein
LVEPHYSLAEAAKRHFPEGKITARSLRTEIEKGNLPRKKIAGKLVTCDSDIARMLEKTCQDVKAVPVSISAGREAIDAATTRYEASARSQSARAAALMTSKEREHFSRGSSPAPIDRQKERNIQVNC